MPIKLIDDTPIEEYNGIYVKREDLCAPPGAPPFSKIRGLIKHLEKLKQQGYIGVAYVETSVSMAGWGVAWACAHHLGLKCMIFNPVYKNTPPLLEFHRQQWKMWGAELIDVPAGRAKVNFHIAKKQVPEGYKLLPLGLPLPETLEETVKIAKEVVPDFPTIVISTGSGTITAGVWMATEPKQIVYGVMTRSGDIKQKRKHIKDNPLALREPFQMNRGQLVLIDEGWEYSEPCKVEVPFPCHPWYDAKAWSWLVTNQKHLKPPVLFWNIGSAGSFSGPVN